MRVCVVGGGLAGTLLAWRLAGLAAGTRVDLVRGRRTTTDATAASGGSVRAYEADPARRMLAAASMGELLASPVLRSWARFRHGPAFTVLRGGPTCGLRVELAELDAVMPGSAEVVDAAELTRLGWTGLPDPAVAVRERLAGQLSPDLLRTAVLADIAHRVSVSDGELTSLGTDRAPLVCAIDGDPVEYDRVVLATGPWTPTLLRSLGLTATGYRVKAVRYGLYPAGDWRPPTFVDEAAGVFGRPADAGELLLGRPTEEWGVHPDDPQQTVQSADRAVRMALDMFPMLRLGPARASVASADCYADTPVPALRPVPGAAPGLFTFTGGAGGAAKNLLAASAVAANQLVEPDTRVDALSLSLGSREGQP